MNKSIYLPKNEKEIFKVCQSKEGLVIPLQYFGINHHHITFYIKEIHGSKLKISLHLTEEKSDNIVFEKIWVLSKEEIEKQVNKKKDKLIQILSKQFEKVKKQSLSTKDVYCIDCLISDKKLSQAFKRKKALKEFRGSLPKLEETYGEKILNYPLCMKPKHNLLYNNKNGQIVYRYFNFVIEPEKIKEYSDEIASCFYEELALFDKTFIELRKSIRKKRSLTYRILYAIQDKYRLLIQKTSFKFKWIKEIR